MIPISAKNAEEFIEQIDIVVRGTLCDLKHSPSEQGNKILKEIGHLPYEDQYEGVLGTFIEHLQENDASTLDLAILSIKYRMSLEGHEEEFPSIPEELALVEATKK